MTLASIAELLELFVVTSLLSLSFSDYKSLICFDKPSFCLMVNISLRNAISVCILVTTWSLSALINSFLLTLYMTFLALSANLSVEIVSAVCLYEGFRVATNKVFVPPPNESCSSLVNYDSLNGM